VDCEQGRRTIQILPTSISLDSPPKSGRNSRIVLTRSTRDAPGRLDRCPWRPHPLAASGAVLALFVNPLWAVLPAFVGSGLVFAGVTDTCGMAMLLSRLPYNRPARS
jgi:hypothetical protein